PAGSRGQVVKLATAWGSTGFEKHSAEIAATLAAEVADEKLADARRTAAARQLAEFRPGDAKVVEGILDAVTLRTSPALATGLIEAAGTSTAPSLGASIIARYAGWS